MRIEFAVMCVRMLESVLINQGPLGFNACTIFNPFDHALWTKVNINTVECCAFTLFLFRKFYYCVTVPEGGLIGNLSFKFASQYSVCF